ncbi:MAG: hypothetical protein AB3K77_08440 [Methanosarcinaceae archaeon]
MNDCTTKSLSHGILNCRLKSLYYGIIEPQGRIIASWNFELQVKIIVSWIIGLWSLSSQVPLRNLSWELVAGSQGVGRRIPETQVRGSIIIKARGEVDYKYESK